MSPFRLICFCVLYLHTSRPFLRAKCSSSATAFSYSKLDERSSVFIPVALVWLMSHIGQHALVSLHTCLHIEYVLCSVYIYFYYVWYVSPIAHVTTSLTCPRLTYLTCMCAHRVNIPACQVLLFSATVPDWVRRISAAYLKNPLSVSSMLNLCWSCLCFSKLLLKEKRKHKEISQKDNFKEYFKDIRISRLAITGATCP